MSVGRTASIFLRSRAPTAFCRVYKKDPTRLSPITFRRLPFAIVVDCDMREEPGGITERTKMKHQDRRNAREQTGNRPRSGAETAQEGQRWGTEARVAPAKGKATTKATPAKKVCDSLEPIERSEIMASRAIDPEKSEQRSFTSEPLNESVHSALSENLDEKEIAVFAYRFWHERGCPIGSDQEDWFRAERELAESKRTGEEAVGNQTSAEGHKASVEGTASTMLRFPERSEVISANEGTN